MAYLSLIGLAIVGVAVYDAAIADRKQQVHNKKRMNAVENCGILHCRLIGGNNDSRID